MSLSLPFSFHFTNLKCLCHCSKVKNSALSLSPLFFKLLQRLSSSSIDLLFSFNNSTIKPFVVSCFEGRPRLRMCLLTGHFPPTVMLLLQQKLHWHSVWPVFIERVKISLYYFSLFFIIPCWQKLLSTLISVAGSRFGSITTSTFGATANDQPDTHRHTQADCNSPVSD